MGLKVSSAKWRPFCLGLNVLMPCFLPFLPVGVCCSPCERNAHCKGHIVRIDLALVDTCYIDDVNSGLFYTDAYINKLYVMLYYVMSLPEPVITHFIDACVHQEA